MFASFKRLDFWSLLEHPPPGVDIHILRAANSDRHSQRELDALEGIQRAAQLERAPAGCRSWATTVLRAGA